MIAMWILKNCQQIKWDSLQRKWKVPRQLHIISCKWVVTHKLCKSMSHQCTEMSLGKHKKRKSLVKPKQPSHQNVVEENPQVSHYNKRSFDPRIVQKNTDRCSKCGDFTHVEGFQCPAKKFQCKACHKFGHSTSLCYQKKQASFMSRRPKVHQLQAGLAYVQ